MHMRGYVPIRSLHTCFAKLPQRKMLGEFNILIYFYVTNHHFHFISRIHKKNINVQSE